MATLAPLMLWGAAVAHAHLGATFVVAFVVLQVCLRSGAAARWLFPGSLAPKAVGLLLAAAIGARFFAVCVAYVALGALYAHPRSRWKAHPWLGWFALAFGDGALATIGGVVAASRPHVGPEVAWGVVAAALLVGAMRPLGQVLHLERDRARGDRTMAVALGRKGTCGASIALALLGTAAASTSARLGGRAFDAAVLALAAVPLIAGASWACRPAPAAVMARRVLVVQIAAGAAFAAYAALRVS